MRLSVVQAAITLALLSSAFCDPHQPELERLLDEGWVPFEASYYKLGAPTTWEDAAQTGCTQMHERAFLTTIHSVAQHDFIVSQFASDEHIWIGLNDITEEGHFTWVNGDALDFTYWAPGEPDDDNGQDCVRLWYDQGFLWDDVICDHSFPFVCKLAASDV